jgi:hypothetical protein
MIRRRRARRIKRHRNHDVAGVAEMLGVTPQTVRAWTRQGLPIIDDRRPFLILCEALNEFLDARETSRSRLPAIGEFRCFRCQVTCPTDRHQRPPRDVLCGVRGTLREDDQPGRSSRMGRRSRERRQHQTASPQAGPCRSSRRAARPWRHVRGSLAVLAETGSGLSGSTNAGAVSWPPRRWKAVLPRACRAGCLLLGGHRSRHWLRCGPRHLQAALPCRPPSSRCG